MKNLSSSKFAEKQLKKYGWKEGEGIGKANQGMIDPIKASFKFDTAGVGFNIAEEFTVNWWEHLYNTTANKIEAKKSETNVDKIDKEKNPSVEKTEDDGCILNRKNFFYSRFTKASLLINGETKPVEEKEKDVLPKRKEPTSYNGISLSEIKKGKIVSDEDLFKVCEGRTAHKGARHGIKMNGKLARIEEQEKLLAAQLSEKLNQSSSSSKDINDKSKSVFVDDDKKKKEKKKRTNSESNEEQESNIIKYDNHIDNSEQINKKKKKKKKSSKDDDL